MVKSQKVIILVGASSTGKTTLAESLVGRGLAAKAITSTTRAMREGEIDGVHYNFTTKEGLQKQYENGELLEIPNEHAGNLYAASKSGLKQKDGKPVVLILDPNGANTIYQKLKSDPEFDPVVVFLRPIPKDVVIDRIRRRGSSEEELKARMNVFEEESKWFDKIKNIVTLAFEQDTNKGAEENIDRYIDRIKDVIINKVEQKRGFKRK